MDLVVMDWNNTYSDEETDENATEGGPKVILRAEEVGIVLLVLLLWAGAVALFIKNWGKIRMLEPYQPKFNDPGSPQSPVHLHRPSLSLAENHNHMLSCRSSRWHLPVIETSLLTPEYHPRPGHRLRQHSVVVVLATEVALHRMASARKVKSAADLTCTTLYEETDESLATATATPL